MTGSITAMEIPMLFTPLQLGTYTLPNRAVRSAVWEGLATENGDVTPSLVTVMEELAAGGTGLIISSHAYVAPEGQASPRQLAIHDDSFLPGLRQLVGAVHAHGSAVFAQLAHGGGLANPNLSGVAAKGPSPMQREGLPVCDVMTIQDISLMVQQFAAAASRAQQAGFDGVQIHAAHGYGLSQFLSPAVNKRTDEYGGTEAGRRRIVLEAIAAVREAVGPEYPVIIKLNCSDFVENGFSPESMLAMCTALQASGVDAVEMSGGLVVNKPATHCARIGKAKGPEEEAWYKDIALRFIQECILPLILVGGVRSYAVVEELLGEGVAALAFARPLIREPHLIARWKGGDHSPAYCISCNKCYAPLLENTGHYCPLDAPKTTA